MQTGFRIGIELEVLLSHRKKTRDQFEDLEAFANALIVDLETVHSRASRRPRPRVHNDVDGVYEGEEEIEWSLTDDITIKPDNSNQWPLELVSPILSYNKQGDWREHVRELLRSVRKICRIESNASCGFHVHISPPEGTSWDLDSLKSICRAIFYFEGAINTILPANRRNNEYAASNLRENSRLRGKDLRNCLKTIDDCQNNVDFADLMNDNGKRYFAWNFTNLYCGGKYTVEFRQAPGVSDESASLPWIEFVVLFINSSQGISNPQQLSRFSQDVRGLLGFLREFDMPDSDHAVLHNLFRGKTGLIDPAPTKTLTTEERQNFMAKEREAKAKNLIMKKLQST
ncbi:amidoligase enzyme-domain-containing protein [Penicillium odoratum]|uniref:amidoligase enzyme-domain-containing protein n=1 Tax=Penicillium odoratum TaxID=1167516 RepID=UPI00254869DE|nr:amidoligase enzyme-domain-containing protein [Penicillium odoratum]KAJ5778191.1 amidoligase enzyme-domain-containing protein [Penicillium odoratum]